MREVVPVSVSNRIGRTQLADKLRTSLVAFGCRTAQLKIILPKPKLLGVWLSTARRAQIGLGLMLLLLVFVAPPIVSSLTDYLYPPIEHERRILRIFESTQVRANPLRDTRYAQFMAWLWAAGLGLILVQLINHIPAAIAIGRQRALRLQKHADSIALDDPARSARLREEALQLLVDLPTQSGEEPFATVPRDAVSARTKIISSKARPDRRTRYVGANRRYRLERAMGSGGMGVVHAAYDTVLKRPVALKQLFAHLVQDDEQTERFRQEALALASLSHPHIVTVYDLLEDSGHFWIVMELLVGGSLAGKIAEAPKMEVDESVAAACRVAAALGFAHDNGIIHRDVKPPNILFTADGTPKLTDFGNAKLADSIVHTQEGVMLGSPAYMSPEQVTGHPLDHRTDIYSLGVSLYQMLTGRVPFEGDMRAVLAQHVNQLPRPPRELDPSIPQALEAAVLTMLSKKPEKRFHDAASVISALNEATTHFQKRELAS